MGKESPVSAFPFITADDKVYVIDVDKLEVVKEFKVESFPFWVAVNGNP